MSFFPVKYPYQNIQQKKKKKKKTVSAQIPGHCGNKDLGFYFCPRSLQYIEESVIMRLNSF